MAIAGYHQLVGSLMYTLIELRPIFPHEYFNENIDLVMAIAGYHQLGSLK